MQEVHNQASSIKRKIMESVVFDIIEYYKQRGIRILAEFTLCCFLCYSLSFASFIKMKIKLVKCRDV